MKNAGGRLCQDASALCVCPCHPSGKQAGGARRQRVAIFTLFCAPQTGRPEARAKRQQKHMFMG